MKERKGEGATEGFSFKKRGELHEDAPKERAGMEHAVTRHEAGVGGDTRGDGTGRPKQQGDLQDHDRLRRSHGARTAVCTGFGDSKPYRGTGTSKIYVRDLLLRGFGLGTVGELILLLVGAPAASPALILIGTFASDSHESRGRGDSLARLGGERPSTRPQRSGARGTAALRRGARATDRAAGGRWRGGRWGLRVRGDFAVCVQEVSGDGERTRDEEARGGVERHGGSGGDSARDEGVSAYVPNRVLGCYEEKRGQQASGRSDGARTWRRKRTLAVTQSAVHACVACNPIYATALGLPELCALRARVDGLV